MRAVRGALRRLRVDWEAGLGRLPFFTQRTAVLLLGVLVATPTTTPGLLDPVEELLGPVVSTLVP